MKEKQNQDQQGQVIIEGIISIAIVATTLIGIISLSVFALRISTINSRKTKAHALAQEAVENMRAVRDGEGIVRQKDDQGGTVDHSSWDWSAVPETPQYFIIYNEVPDGFDPAEATPVWVLEDVSTYTEHDLLELKTPVHEIFKLNYNDDSGQWEHGTENNEASNQGFMYRQIKIVDSVVVGDFIVGGDKILLCHNGSKTISVAPPAQDPHIAHGDDLGSCEDGPIPSPTPDPESKIVTITVSFQEGNDFTEIIYASNLSNWQDALLN